jgi:hypothetical protein
MPLQTITPTTYTAGAVSFPATVAVITRSTFQNQLRTDLEDVYYNQEEFAEDITWNYSGGATQTIPAIFDEEHMGSDIETGAPAIVSEPQIHVPTHMFTGRPGEGDSVLIRNRPFKVKEVLPDGTGVCVVSLLRE